MARPIPKAILFQTSDSLGITGHFPDVLYNSMFDGAKKCPEMNSGGVPKHYMNAKSRIRPSCL